MSRGLVSVVVPVYNVKEYLGRCVESIINQTYENIEIILVNDGSKDASGLMCDEYAKMDSRIKVFHKSNGGLSDARNYGIDRAMGEYLLFVDSDDWISQDTVEYLLSQATVNHCDIAMASYQCVYGDTDLIKANGSINNVQILRSGEALSSALYGKNSTLHAWGKLFKANLFSSGIRFPKGRIYEDAGTIYKLIHRAERILVSSVKKYYYLQRSGSIINSGFYPRMMDSVHFAKEMLDFAKDKQPQSVKAARLYLFMSAISMLGVMTLSKKHKLYKIEASECTLIANRLKYSVLMDQKAPFKSRLFALMAVPGVWVIIAAYALKRIVKELRNAK